MRPSPGKKGLKELRQVRPGYAWLLCIILCYLVVSGFEDQHPLIWAAATFMRVSTFMMAFYVSGVSRRFFLTTVALALIVAGASVHVRMYHSWLEGPVLAFWSVILLLVPGAILRKLQKEFGQSLLCPTRGGRQVELPLFQLHHAHHDRIRGSLPGIRTGADDRGHRGHHRAALSRFRGRHRRQRLREGEEIPLLSR
jgi:hypothetical protein